MAGTNSVFSVNDNQKIQKSRNGPGVPIEIAFSATGSDCLMDLSSERFSRRTEMDGWMDGWMRRGLPIKRKLMDAKDFIKCSHLIVSFSS